MYTSPFPDSNQVMTNNTESPLQIVFKFVDIWERFALFS